MTDTEKKNITKKIRLHQYQPISIKYIISNATYILRLLISVPFRDVMNPMFSDSIDNTTGMRKAQLFYCYISCSPHQN